MGLLLHPIVCLFVSLSVYLSVVLTACLPVRPAAQLWALSDKTPVNAFDMWTENFDEKKYFYYSGNGSSSNAMPILDMENPYLSKCSSHLQTQCHGTCDSICI